MALPRRSLIALGLVLAAALFFWPTPTRAQALHGRWRRLDEKAQSSLLAGSFEDAHRRLEKVVREMLAELGPSPEDGKVLAVVLMHRALAEAGLGHREDALWDWSDALNFDPDLAREDLSHFGAEGRLLAAHPLRDPAADHLILNGTPEPLVSTADSSQPPSAVDPPHPLEVRPPELPPRAAKWHLSGPIAVAAVIDRDGRPFQPVVTHDPGAAILTFWVMEAFRQWRFRPARLHGEPVAATYSLRIDYRVK